MEEVKGVRNLRKNTERKTVRAWLFLAHNWFAQLVNIFSVFEAPVLRDMEADQRPAATVRLSLVSSKGQCSTKTTSNNHYFISIICRPSTKFYGIRPSGPPYVCCPKRAMSTRVVREAIPDQNRTYFGHCQYWLNPLTAGSDW